MKSEARISPDFIKWVETNPNFKNSKYQNFFDHCDLGFRDCFEFRASDFEFKNFLKRYKIKTGK